MAVLYLLSYFQIITLSITLYKFCVTSFGDYGALVFPPWCVKSLLPYCAERAAS